MYLFLYSLVSTVAHPPDTLFLSTLKLSFCLGLSWTQELGPSWTQCHCGLATWVSRSKLPMQPQTQVFMDSEGFGAARRSLRAMVHMHSVLIFLLSGSKVTKSKASIILFIKYRSLPLLELIKNMPANCQSQELFGRILEFLIKS